jgi:branched-chain amino acid transport system substrate-binding protein
MIGKKLALLGLAGLALCMPSLAQADISIGLIAPLSGQYAVFGEQIRKGAEAAIADINRAGGVNGKKLKLETADDACDPKQAVAAANQMVSKNVKYVIGHYCSGSAIPSSKVFLEEGAVMISPGATNPALTDEGGKGIFRVCGRDDRQGAVVAETIAKEFKTAKIALLHDKSAYGRGLAEETRKALNAAGVTETMFEAYTAGEKDYSALVANLKQKAIDVIFVGGYHTEAGLITRQLREAGSKAQVFGGDALVTNEFWSITGPAGEGVLMTFGPDPRKNPDASEVVKNLRAAGYEPEGYTLYAYAAAQVFAEAIKAAASTETSKVLPEMYNTEFKTVLGSLAFDGKGDIKSPAYVIYKWHAGSYAERE